jgi:hypothetical protein
MPRAAKEFQMIRYKRRIILRSISTAAAVTIAGVPLKLLAAAQRLDPKDPQAVSLGYTEDTTTVDKKKFPKHDKSQTCDNCQFYTTAQEAGSRAPCTIFGNRTVAAKGWCSAWVKKAV